jgi:hypothetical protein
MKAEEILFSSASIWVIGGFIPVFLGVLCVLAANLGLKRGAASPVPAR